MAVEIKEVNTKQDIKKFVNFQFDLYKDEKNWVPPIKADEIKALMPEHNPAYKFCDAKFFLAYKDGKIAGRVGAIINNAYNEKTGEKYVRISRIEFIDDEEVFDALINKVIEFGKGKGMAKIHGPLGFTNLDTQGMLIEGFEYLPSIASVYHKSYYKKHFDRLGFSKEIDWIEFRLTLVEQAINKAKRGAEILKKRFGFKVLNFSSKKEMLKYAPKIFEILNDAFSDLPFVVPFDKELAEFYTKKYFSILNPAYVRVVLNKEDEVIGFIVGLPSLSKAMQKAGGKLFPFGFIPILKALKHPQEIDLLLTGVAKEYQNSGVAVMLFADLQDQMLREGIYTMETTGIFETNTNAISNWKNYEHIQHKRRRCFIKDI
jgi:GNAT superfamily N-acetyltransferase